MASREISVRVPLWRRAALGVCALMTLGAMTATPAEARHWRHHYAYRHHAAVARYVGPPFSATVVDENTGRTLYSVNENEFRHPASITKVMTLYLLFEKLANGSLTLQSRFDISQNAANQEPSKLGIAPGETISVDDAIKAVVTRSANDVAVAIAENLGGSEGAFADQMTRKAHELGMSRTTYRNASGLPNDEQITTAHDLAILARAVQEKFPVYFKYFSTHEFDYAGETIGNHNHLLGRVDGVDGIKTGYTRASGFNLMTSMHRDGRSIVAIVMGGHTAGARDRMMEGLLANTFAQASAGQRSTSVFAQAAPAAVKAKSAQPMALASAAPAAPPVKGPDVLAVAAVLPSAQIPAPTLIAAAPVAPAKPVSIQVASLAPVLPREVAAPALPPVRVAAPIQLASVKADSSDEEADAQDAVTAKVRAYAPAAPHLAAPAIPAPRPALAAAKPSKADFDASDADPAPAAKHDGWVIQLGATDDQSKAKTLLQKALAQNRAMLASAKPLTQKVQKGEDTLYRARFAMNDGATADAACKSLKKTGFSCIAMHD